MKIDTKATERLLALTTEKIALYRSETVRGQDYTHEMQKEREQAERLSTRLKELNAHNATVTSSQS